MLINPLVPPTADLEVVEQDVNSLSFGVSFTPLNSCRKTGAEVDLYPEITDVKAWIGQTLTAANSAHGGRITKFIEERLTPESRTTLMQVMSG